MKSKHSLAVIGAAALVLGLATAPVATAQEYETPRGAEITVLGGVQALQQNDSALPDDAVNVPVALALAYHLTPVFAAEGELTWIIPVEQSMDAGDGTKVDARTPDILAYQANLRANLPLESSAVSPYLTAGAGAVTFLSNTDADRRPQLAEDETAFAVNFGGGATWRIQGPLALRADFRELVAFPSDDAGGLARDGSADDIWMTRGTVGLAWRF